jgi:hypothetical protein
MHFWLNGSFFSGDDQDLLKEEIKTYLMPPCSPLNWTKNCTCTRGKGYNNDAAIRQIWCISHQNGELSLFSGWCLWTSDMSEKHRFASVVRGQACRTDFQYSYNCIAHHFSPRPFLVKCNDNFLLRERSCSELGVTTYPYNASFVTRPFYGHFLKDLIHSYIVQMAHIFFSSTYRGGYYVKRN